MHGTLIGKMQMDIQDHTGHTTIEWDPGNSDEVAIARHTFNEMLGKGMHAFAIERKGQPGRRMTTFDPQAGEMILMVAQLVGG